MNRRATNAETPEKGQGVVRRAGVVLTNGGRKSPTSPKDGKSSSAEVEWMRSDYVAEKVSEMKLNYPPGMHRRTIEEMDAEDVEKRMLGLPGELQLDKLTTEKYFGGVARDKFFNRFQWLSHQRCIINSRPNEDLDHLYFESEKHDTAKMLPFGPLRSGKDATDTLGEASVTGSQPSVGSAGSAFRNRFRAASGSEAGSVQDNETRMLQLSAMRSGVRQRDFEDDLAHAAEDAVLYGEMVNVQTPARTPRGAPEHQLTPQQHHQNQKERADKAETAEAGDEESEWDNVSEVTMAEEDIARLESKGFYETRSKKQTHEDPVSSLKSRQGGRQDGHGSQKAAQKTSGRTSTQGGSTAQLPAVQRQGQVQVPSTAAATATAPEKRLTFEQTMDAAAAQARADQKAQASKGGAVKDSALTKTNSHNGLKAGASAGSAPPVQRMQSLPAYPNNPHGSLRIKYLTPGPAAVPQTNATAFTGQLRTDGGVAGTTIAPNVSPEHLRAGGSPPAGQGKDRDKGTKEPAASSSDKLPPTGSRRPQTAAARAGTSSRAVTASTLSGQSSRAATPRRDGSAATVNTANDAASAVTPSGKTARGARPASAMAAARASLLSAASAALPLPGLTTVASPQSSVKANSAKAARAQRSAARSATVPAVAGKGPGSGAPDAYSKIILEDLLAKRNALVQLQEDGSVAESVNQSSVRLRNSTHDEDSVITASTVSTVGLGLYLDSLRNTSGGPGSGKSGMASSHTMVPITSPRTKYLAGCMREGLNPRASLVLRKNMSKSLNLQHHGMGDQMGRLLAEVIQGLPHIQSINIADNMLTDIGMGPIILAAVGIPGLLELNLSQNEIGPVSAKALFEYLISPTCPLERLILRNADVDDYECERFVEAIKENNSLVELDLSNNKIGSAENLNTVMPDLTTGGEALAELLRLPSCRLKTLKVDWNMIRLDGAVDFADSLRTNRTLTYLDLSYNSLGTDGGIMLGVSILSNTTLETLILQSNNLDSVACFTICAGIIENRGLKKVVLDGNPIGEQGMKALMLIPMIAGNRVKVTAARCNISIRDPRCWFNFEKLIADYDLNMEDGFHRAIAIILLHLIAGHHTFVFTKYIHETVKSGKVAQRKIDLVQQASTEASQHFDKRQRFVLDGLLKMKAAASDIQTAIRLFQEVDADNSGELDKSELKDLMGRMGIEVSEKRLSELMAQYDVDQGGKIELHEFLMLLKSQYKEALARIKELVEAPIMVLRSDRSKQYLPPTRGTLRITVADGFAKKDQYRIMSACDREYISEVTRDMSGASAAAMISSSLQGTKLRLDEGLMVAQRMLEDCPDKVAVIKKLVLQMNDTSDARNLITSLLEEDRTELLRLKRDFGASLRPILGNPNGYYILDLAKEMDRMCLEKLLEISTTSGNKRMEASKIGYGRCGDLSQKGNWSSFRNELLNGEPVVLSPAFAQPIPLSGKLEFDFSGAGRPTRDALPVSDVRVVKILMNNGLLHPHDSPLALYKLSVLATAAEKTLGCEGRNYYEVPMERARLIGEHIEQFYEQLHLRSKHFEQTQEKELSVAVDQNGDLIDLFEQEKYPVFMHVGDFLDANEQLGPVPFEVGVLGGAPAPLGRKGKPLQPRDADGRRGTTAQQGGGGGGGGGGEGGSDSDSESCSSGSSSSSSSSGSSDGSRSDASSSRRKKRKKSSGEESESDSDSDAAEGEEEEDDADWQKTFELMKKQYLTKQAVPMESAKMVSEKRKNIALVENPMAMIEGDEFLDRFRELLRSRGMQSGAKAHRIVDLLEDLFARSWIFCRHLVLILECFAANYGYLRQTRNHGTYRVDVIVALFGRIIDLHNFEFVMKILAPSEAACVYCRLGWLNVYNPCKPEGAWELDMSRREERVLAKTLCVLATNEPGDNWVFQTFRWMRSMESMPGWELTQPWLTEEGMPMRGLVNITYYSGEGVHKKGCRPYVNFRKALLNLVLVNEEEIVSEDMRNKPAPAVQPGDRAFQKHLTLWDQYLCPDWVDPNRKR